MITALLVTEQTTQQWRLFLKVARVISSLNVVITGHLFLPLLQYFLLHTAIFVNFLLQSHTKTDVQD